MYPGLDIRFDRDATRIKQNRTNGGELVGGRNNRDQGTRIIMIKRDPVD
jgi:hypothetical protein